ncbi:MAG: bifunctional (p)ppGpp synthetase/guanosine-3',5'-bis(diphosphate) 3'-pyrophosphohydrolase [Desulfobacterales bacterium]|nr:bifunctional (p)ppGpp synthetase/guanosine-3',5'-bis(diphosphate) 3'-pyrophosphohydrolase [Desulfobacterales bacterium]
MIGITDVLNSLTTYLPNVNQELLERAYTFATRYHQAKKKASEARIAHLLQVALILTDMKLDFESIASGLLHDIFEETKATEEEITNEFGLGIYKIVIGVSKLSMLPYKPSVSHQVENLRKMILAMSEDLRVIFIKLADRLDDMRTLHLHPNLKHQHLFAQETHDVYIPIAGRLGIYWIKQELEDIVLQYLHTEEYQQIKQNIEADQIDRESYIGKVKSIIIDKLQEYGFSAKVSGRVKSYYSIYNKMITQNLSYEEIYDIIAFRIIVDSISQCYETLGIIHALWKPIPKKFKDYISMPKANMYQSLHTTVFGPYGKRVEIQIRTKEMDQVAKSGIAAHWSYKEGREFDEQTKATFRWIQELVQQHLTIKDPDEFLEHVLIDFYPDEIYVFTPKGDIKNLPKNSTPLDFAYSVHSEVGNECVGAKVDGRLVSLDYPLKTGNMVEVLTSKGHQPSKDWLHYVKTAKARSKIRQWIKQQERDRSIALGKEICEKAFRKARLNFYSFLKDEKSDDVVKTFHFDNMDDLLAHVGYGKITPNHVIQKYTPHEEDTSKPSLFRRFIESTRKKRAGSGVVVKGLNDILIRFSKCCQPIPDDDIIGYITQGHGISIHRRTCANALTLNPERQIEVEWDRSHLEAFPVKIHIQCLDRFGLLSDITSTITKNKINIIDVNSRLNDYHMVDCVITLSVSDTEQLNKIISAIRKVKYVKHVRRIE